MEVQKTYSSGAAFPKKLSLATIGLALEGCRVTNGCTVISSVHVGQTCHPIVDFMLEFIYISCLFRKQFLDCNCTQDFVTRTHNKNIVSFYC